MALTFNEARACVLREVSARRASPPTERISSLESAGRILAEPILADRDYPPFHRSARDGFAIRAADLPGQLDVIGEVAAGSVFTGHVGPGQAVEIMTGAPLPDGADAVVMVEHVTREADRITTDRSHHPGDNYNERGLEARAGATVMEPGRRLGYAEIAALAMVGYTDVAVYRKPRVAIIPTGDELVEVSQTPAPHQIRNSNAWSMAVQVARAGGDPRMIGIARDNYESTRELIEQGLEMDLVLLSGGVSAGKYDIVEKVLADVHAEFFFDRVKIQPGQPLVFGRAPKPGAAEGSTFFFGLPGNPASTMVTFEIFARAALELLSGAAETPLPFLNTRLAADFRQKPGLTRFLPARLSADGATVQHIPWRGSGDVAAIARANAFLVTDPERDAWVAGDWIQVLPK